MRFAAATTLLVLATGCVNDIALYEDENVPLELAELGGRLSWRTPIRADLVPSAAQSPLLGESLYRVVSGQSAIVDGKACTECHYAGSDHNYEPAQVRGAVLSIEPDVEVDGRRWDGSFGWAMVFCELGESLDEGEHGEVLAPMKDALEVWKLHGERATERLTWTSAITPENVGAEPDPRAAGATLDDAINNRVSPRPDGKLCVECHYAGGDIPYRPAPGAVIGPDSVVDGRSWSGPEGWAARFITLDENAHIEKPAYVRAVFAKWLADGAR